MATQYHQALLPGTRLFEYEILDVLGSGGFGIVYRAHDHALAQQMVIKEYLPAGCSVRLSGSTVAPASSKEEKTFRWGLERFLNEARALAEFRHHPNIVSVLRHFNANNTAYMVMEYAGSMSLQDYLDERQTLTEPQLNVIVPPLLDALEKVHAKGIIHRDIKPSNILINSEGQPVLIDFGAARQALEPKTVIVTSGYSPFEQYAETGRQGPWTDIYALAAVMYRCVTGDMPPDIQVRAALDAPALVVAEKAQGQYSPALLAAIDWGLQPQVEARPQSIAAWREHMYMCSDDEAEQLPSEKDDQEQQPIMGKYTTMPKLNASNAIQYFRNDSRLQRRIGVILFSGALMLGLSMLLYAQFYSKIPEQAISSTLISSEEDTINQVMQTITSLRQELKEYDEANNNLLKIKILVEKGKQAKQAGNVKGNYEEFQRLANKRTVQNQKIVDDYYQKLKLYRNQIKDLCHFQMDKNNLLVDRENTVSDKKNIELLFKNMQTLCNEKPLSDVDLIKELE